ncbi:hypothetical protein [Ekhidna sp.]|uniref:hypothetical protein n=1 Tax=Ekhidna sp. TaxID=2608089 RepID=UPI003B5029D8
MFTKEGRIGIGTDDPNRHLSIIGSSNSFLNLKTGSGYEFLIGADQNGGIISTMSNHDLQIRAGGNSTKMIVKSDGSVGIGTTNPDPNFMLSVNGSIRSKEVKVETNWSDFVFYDNYELRTLEEVEQHINENGHLPDIPSEAEVTENGINLGEMNAKLLQKIEELTLYLIEQNKKIQRLEEEVSTLKNE